ncbi:advillin, partial [Aphelenchoides avenae]
GSNEIERKTIYNFIRRMENIPQPVVVYEAEEPSEFWDLLGGFCDYASDKEFRDADVECTARLFHCSNAKGHFHVEEIIAFCQEDLYPEDVMILDAYSKVFVWIGAQSDVVERQRSLQTVQDYVASDPSGRSVDDTEMLVVKQSFEPAGFKAHFPGWDDDYWSNTRTYEELKEQVLRDISVKQSPPLTVCEAQDAFMATYPVEVLRQPVDKLPYGVDPVHKEKHLTDDEFAKVFGIGREQYEAMVRWKQLELKKRVGLF